MMINNLWDTIHKRISTAERGMVACLKAVAAATEAVLTPIDIVAMCPFNVHVPHAVKSLNLQEKNIHLTPAKLQHWQNLLLTMAHVTLKQSTVFNPSILHLAAQDGKPHPCLEVVNTVAKPRDALFDTSLINHNSVFFVDGSAMRNPTHGSPCVSYEICTSHNIVASANLKITCLLRQLFFSILGTGKYVTVHTDSQYAFNVCHDCFHISTGNPTTHRSVIINLLSALLLPVSVAVCKVHTSANDPVSLGNAAAKTAHQNQNQDIVLIPKGK